MDGYPNQLKGADGADAADVADADYKSWICEFLADFERFLEVLDSFWGILKVFAAKNV